MRAVVLALRLALVHSPRHSLFREANEVPVIHRVVHPTERGALSMSSFVSQTFKWVPWRRR
jgi:hypothetical protein